MGWRLYVFKLMPFKLIENTRKHSDSSNLAEDYVLFCNIKLQNIIEITLITKAVSITVVTPSEEERKVR